MEGPEFEEGEENEKPIDPTVDVAVMNGSGRVLAAEDLAEALRERRYNARAAGNADDFSYEASVVYYAEGFRAPARKIRGALGRSASTAPLDEGDANGNEVVVVAGDDWDGRPSRRRSRRPGRPRTRSTPRASWIPCAARDARSG